MRDAKASDWLRRLKNKHGRWTTEIHRIALKGTASIGELELPIQSPLTVLAGANGVGKTTILRAIWAGFDPSAAAAIIASSKKLIAGSITIDLSVGEIKEVAEARFSEDALVQESSSSVTVQHIDSATFVATYQAAFCEFQSSEEIVNGVSPRELNDANLAEINFIINRDYRRVVVYEVELNAVVPFFEVTYGNDTYDSRTMGAGEMAALYVWWGIRRAESNSIILIEEPEACLSYNCQSALAKFLVKSVVDNGIVCIVSSHAAAFIYPLPKDSLLFLSRGQSGLALVADSPPPVLLQQLGIEPPTRAVMFVEDSIGRLTCRAILEHLDPLLSRQIHVEQRNGDGEVIGALRPLMSVDGPISFVGMFDGDVRSSVPKELLPFSAFLPGDVPMERAFRVMVADPACPAMKDYPKLEAISAALEGKDHHDWYEETAKGLGLTRDQLFFVFFEAWFKMPGNADACSTTFDEVLKALRLA